MMQYQGYITVNAQPFTGAGAFKFALVDRQGTNTYWSRDGFSTGGGAPLTTLSNIAVLNGLYSILLGDRAINGMTRAIQPSIFADHRDVFLRVWFDDGTNGIQQLAPDTRIASVGFAMTAATVVPGGIDGTALAPGLTLGGATSGSSQAGVVTLKSGADQTRVSLEAGSSSAGGSLKLYESSGTHDTVRLVAADSGSGGAQLLLKNGSGTTTLELDAQDGSSTNATGLIRFKNKSGTNVLVLDSDPGNTNSGLLFYNALATQETLRITGAENGDKAGFVSVKTLNGDPTIVLRGQETTDATSGGLVEVKTVTGKQAIALRSKYGVSDSGAILLGNTTGNKTVEIVGDGGEAQGRLILKHSDLQPRVKIDGDGINNGGQAYVYNADSTVTATLAGELGSGNGGLLLYANDQLGAHETVRITGAFQGTGAGCRASRDCASDDQGLGPAGSLGQGSVPGDRDGTPRCHPAAHHPVAAFREWKAPVARHSSSQIPGDHRVHRIHRLSTRMET